MIGGVILTALVSSRFSSLKSSVPYLVSLALSSASWYLQRPMTSNDPQYYRCEFFGMRYEEAQRQSEYRHPARDLGSTSGDMRALGNYQCRNVPQDS